MADDQERTAAPPTRAQQDQTGHLDAAFAAERVAAIAVARRASDDADIVDMACRRSWFARDGSVYASGLVGTRGCSQSRLLPRLRH